MQLHGQHGQQINHKQIFNLSESTLIFIRINTYFYQNQHLFLSELTNQLTKTYFIDILISTYNVLSY
jgi:hypothetical protein